MKQRPRIETARVAVERVREDGVAVMRWARVAMLAYVVSFLATALYDVRPGGDCGEYIIMARGFADRGAPNFTDSDARWLASREKRLRPVARHLRAGLQKELEATTGTRRTASGQYFSIHFWFYSLLAAPALFLLELVEGPPLPSLTFVNAAAALAAAAYALRTFRGTWVALVAPGAFLLTGTTFYLAYTGPEVLTASGVFIAALAARRGDLGVGFLAAGVASTQNPSAAAMLAFVAFEGWRRWRAARAGTAPDVRLGWRTLELATAGVLLAALPYLFYQVEFGVPSLIGKYATEPALIGFDRAISLFFDLNQGMAAGLPGLFVGLLAVFVLARARVGTWAVRIAATLGIVLVMAIPTLAAPNWNPGTVVFLRYGYWLAMPLLALLLELCATLPWRSGAPALALLAGFQVPVLIANGYRGDDSSYLRHGLLARTVLEHAPAAYNPEPEIFVERTLGRETGHHEDKPVIWPRHGAPRKILVHERAVANLAGECPPGREHVPSSVRLLAGGWQYQNGPFTCRPTAAK